MIGRTKDYWPWIFATPFLICLSEYLAIAPIGTYFFLGFFGPMVILSLLAAIPCILILPFFLISRKWRKGIASCWLACSCFVVLALVGVRGGEVIRTSAFKNLAKRSAPLVRAITRYSAEHGSPPDSLDALLPDYLDKLPSTGMMAYPKYRYAVGSDAMRYEGNPWILRIFTPSGGINFDEFFYFPLQNYPESGYGGSWERVEDWAYLHE